MAAIAVLGHLTKQCVKGYVPTPCISGSVLLSSPEKLKAMGSLGWAPSGCFGSAVASPPGRTCAT